MNILAIIIGIISFMILIVGILSLIGILFTKKVSIVGKCEASGSDCEVTYKDKDGIERTVEVYVKDISKHTNPKYLYIKSGDANKGNLKSSDVSLDRPLNIIGVILTILAILGIILSIVLYTIKPKIDNSPSRNILPSYPSSPSYMSPSYIL